MASLLGGLLVLLLASPAVAQWRSGRATFYGADGWSIHTGSCRYGQLAEDVGTGWDVAALADAVKDYSGSCGRCKEIKCKPSTFKDGYGAWLDRKDACYDSTASVVVMIVDTCPCYYPNNYFSNKRWCCGDMYHMDISLWAFEKLADTKYGVVGIEYRDVDCGYRPPNPAKNPWGARSPMPDKLRPRPGWNRWMDKRLAFMKNPNPTSLPLKGAPARKPAPLQQQQQQPADAPAQQQPAAQATLAPAAAPTAPPPQPAEAPRCFFFFCGRRLLRA